MGEQVFKQMARELSMQPQSNKTVSASSYTQWCKEYTFNTLAHTQRYGQNFCNVFGITDNILYYEQDPKAAGNRIRNCYVA
jgi:hypothetical protein